MCKMPVATALALILSASVSAQWLDFREPAIPRSSDGKPNLAAPAPRTPDGKPDLAGLWEPEASPYRPYGQDCRAAHGAARRNLLIPRLMTEASCSRSKPTNREPLEESVLAPTLLLESLEPDTRTP